MAEFVRYERALRKTLREEARRSLGPQATDAEVQALADEAYWGPRPTATDLEETADERERREREHARRTAETRPAASSSTRRGAPGGWTPLDGLIELARVAEQDEATRGRRWSTACWALWSAAEDRRTAGVTSPSGRPGNAGSPGSWERRCGGCGKVHGIGGWTSSLAAWST